MKHLFILKPIIEASKQPPTVFCDAVREVFGDEAADIIYDIYMETLENCHMGLFASHTIPSRMIDAVLEYVLGIYPEHSEAPV